MQLDSPVELTQSSELLLDPRGRPLRLRLRRLAGDQETRLEVDFDLGPAGGRARIRRPGSDEGPGSPEAEQEERPVDPDIAVVATNVLHHLALLPSRYDAERGGVQTLPFFPGTSLSLEEREPRQARLAGELRTLRHLFVDIAGLYGIDLFLLDGRVVKIALPLQRLEAVLQGVPGLDRGTELALPEEAEGVPEEEGQPAEEVRFPTAGGLVLAGTLTRPLDAAEPHPAVVLLSGSGPQDRDSDTGPGGLRLGLFRTLAEHLSARGLAVLRFDDRGTGASGGDFLSAGVEDLVADARAAVRWLSRHPSADPLRLALVGHSEGGLVAALASGGAPGVRAIALLATLARPLDEVLLRQFETLTARLLPPERHKEALERRRRTLEILKTTGDWEHPEVEEQVRRAVPETQRRWFADHFALDPARVIAQVEAAVGIFQGGRDLQVDPEDAGRLERALDRAGHRDHTVFRFPELDHLFMPSSGRGLTEYADPRRRLDPEFLRTLGSWLLEKLGADSAGR